MRGAIWRGIAVGVCLLGTLPSTSARAGDDNDKDKAKNKEIAWVKSYDSAVEQAKKQKKLIMVDMYADWCGPCKMLDKKTYTDPKVVKFADDRFVSLKLDIDHDGKDAATKYGIQSIPTILFLDPSALSKIDEPPASGEIVGKIVGFKTAEPFLDDLKRIDESYREFPKLVDKLKADPSNVEILGKLVVLYHERADDQKAIELLGEADEKDPKNSKGYLTKAYNAVGDAYQADAMSAVQKGDVPKRDALLSKATSLFGKAAKTGKDPNDLFYAKSSIAACLFMRNELKKGAAELEAALKIPGISAANKEQGEALLDQVKAFLKQSDDRKKDDK